MVKDSEFNELRFDDKKGSEEIYMEAGKDHNWIIHNDQTGTVENDQTVTVKNDQKLTVEQNRTATVSRQRHTDRIEGQSDDQSRLREP